MLQNTWVLIAATPVTMTDFSECVSKKLLKYLHKYIDIYITIIKNYVNFCKTENGLSQIYANAFPNSSRCFFFFFFPSAVSIFASHFPDTSKKVKSKVKGKDGIFPFLNFTSSDSFYQFFVPTYNMFLAPCYLICLVFFRS